MLIATLTLTICMTIGAVAQTNLAGADVKVTIPFNFYAGDQSLPAGIYVVKTEIAHRVIILRGQRPRLVRFNQPTGIYEHTGTRTAEFQALWQQLLPAGSVVAGRAEGQQIRVGKLNENWRPRASLSKW